MSVEVFEHTVEPITLTPPARRHLVRQLEHAGKSAIRLSIKESGCTGFMYVITETDKPEADDLAVKSDELMVYVDPKSLPMIRGTQLDFVFQGLNQVLIFNNPNVTAACGCGESFSIEEGVKYQ
jgi:iron-sulfur cluster assembly accessory protein